MGISKKKQYSVLSYEEKIRKFFPNRADDILSGRVKRKSRDPLYQREYLRRMRASAVEILGGVCRRCGFADSRALQIDHVNGGGSKERKNRPFTGSFHRVVIKSVLKKENKYQLLCANCNWIKRHERNETRHVAKEY
jgi:hypothetical protein